MRAFHEVPFSTLPSRLAAFLVAAVELTISLLPRVEGHRRPALALARAHVRAPVVRMRGGVRR